MRNCKHIFDTNLCSKVQSCSVSKETSDVTVTRGMLWSNEVCIITLALLQEFVYEFRGNNTYIILDRAAFESKHR